MHFSLESIIIQWTFRLSSLYYTLSRFTDENKNVVMTGGSFTTTDDADSVVTSQPPSLGRDSDLKKKQSISKATFDDAHCERSWSTGLCGCCADKRRHCEYILFRHCPFHLSVNVFIDVAQLCLLLYQG